MRLTLFLGLMGIAHPHLADAADFTYAPFSAGGIAITSYIGSAATVVVPAEIDGLSVKAIEDRAFSGKDVVAVSIPSTSLVIGDYAFENCGRLTTVTIMGNSYIDGHAFENCTNLTGVYFAGNPPGLDSTAFSGANLAIMYYLPTATGWGTTFGGRTTSLWNPNIAKNDPNFGLRNGRFGFTITGTPGITVLTEATSALAPATWTVVGTNILSGGSSSFVDPHPSTNGSKIYRFRSP